jgi:hypothetical protein
MNQFINPSERIYERKGTEYFVLILGEDESRRLVESVIRRGYTCIGKVRVVTPTNKLFGMPKHPSYVRFDRCSETDAAERLEFREHTWGPKHVTYSRRLIGAD